MALPVISHAQNTWVKEKIYTSSNSGSSFTDITYYDGLGYPVQIVAGKAGGTSVAPNLVTPIVYDGMRRDDVVRYLPYASSEGTNQMVSNAVAKQAQFYSAAYPGETRAYAEKVYEASPVGKPLITTREGAGWLDHPATIDYATNNASDSVIRFSYSHSQKTVLRNGTYDSGVLIKTTSTNEDGQRSIVFTDAWGKTICSRMFPDDNTVIETSYIYDLKDSLVCVIQPKGMDTLRVCTGINSITLDGSFARSNCFTYLRDSLGRVKRSVVPGGTVTEFVYDRRNRLRLMSTERMKDGPSSRKYVMTNYDDYDRLVSRNYIYIDELSLDSLRALVDEDHMPSFTMLRTLYSASYYPFSDGAQSVQGLPFDDEVDNDISMYLSTTGHRGLLKSETIYDVNGITNTYSTANVTRNRAYYYDGKGRVIQMRESDSDGPSATYTTFYDLVGNVTTTIEEHFSPGNVSHTLKTEYMRDARGRVLSCTRTFDGSSLPVTTYSYDALGRLAGKEGGSRLSVSYDYDLHGWRTELAAELDGTDVFNQILNYGSPSGQGAYARWSGAISGSLSKHYGSSSYDGENYNYDNAGRFSGTTRYGLSAHGQPSIATQERIERDVEYDSNGNILELERLLGNSEVHDLTMQYAGNRLQSVTDGNSTSIAYGYDADGNLTYDGRTGFDFSYNILNLPMSAEDGADGSTMTYTYLSDGTKLKALTDSGEGLSYRGSFVYGLSAGGGCSLESVATDEGRLVINGASVKDEWHVTDHVGNVRSVVWLNAPAGTGISDSILEQNDYLPFGTRLPGTREDQTNRYHLGGKEEQNIAGMDLNLSDFGARYYDPFTCRWNASDPLAHKYFGLSPYNYCGNDPINSFDPDGRIVEFDESCSEEFKEKYNEMREWLRANKCDALLKALEDNNAVTIKIKESTEDTHFRPTLKKGNHLSQGYISLDFTHFAKTSDDKWLSPSVMFMHEVDHATEAYMNYSTFQESQKQTLEYLSAGGRYNMTPFEFNAIKGTETSTAVALGEIPVGTITRTSHCGEKVDIPAALTFEGMSSTCGKHNALLPILPHIKIEWLTYIRLH